MDPIGAHSFWGFSPALDLQQLARTVFGAAWPPPRLVQPPAPPTTPVDEVEAALKKQVGEEAPHAKPAPVPAPIEDHAINILLLMPADPRHVIKTISQRYRHSSRPLHVSRTSPCLWDERDSRLEGAKRATRKSR
jgi:hypothetical protein